MARLKGAKTSEFLLKRNKPCLHVGCNLKVKAKGMCITHYAQWRKKTDMEYAANLKAASARSNLKDKLRRDFVREQKLVEEYSSVPEGHSLIIVEMETLQRLTGSHDIVPFLNNLVEDGLIHSFSHNLYSNVFKIIIQTQLLRNFEFSNHFGKKPNSVLE